MSFHAADVVSSANLFLLLGRIACTECKDAAYCYHRGMVCLPTCVCLLDTTLNHTKTDEPIDVSFGLWTRVGQSNHVFCGVRIPRRRGNLWAPPAMRPFVILLFFFHIGQLGRPLIVTRESWGGPDDCYWCPTVGSVDLTATGQCLHGPRHHLV